MPFLDNLSSFFRMGATKAVWDLGGCLAQVGLEVRPQLRAYLPFMTDRRRKISRLENDGAVRWKGGPPDSFSLDCRRHECLLPHFFANCAVSNAARRLKQFKDEPGDTETQ